MQGPLTIELVGIVFAALVVVGGVWGRIEYRIREGDAAAARALESIVVRIREVSDEAMVVAKDLRDYKLTSAEKYASFDQLKEVEVRLTTAVDRLTNRIEQLPRQFAEQVAQILAVKSRR